MVLATHCEHKCKKIDINRCLYILIKYSAIHKEIYNKKYRPLHLQTLFYPFWSDKLRKI